MSAPRDPFFDGGEDDGPVAASPPRAATPTDADYLEGPRSPPPVPTARRTFSQEEPSIKDDPTATPRSPLIRSPVPVSSPPPKVLEEDIYDDFEEDQSTTSTVSSRRDSSIRKEEPAIRTVKTLERTFVDTHTQTSCTPLTDQGIQTEQVDEEEDERRLMLKTLPRKTTKVSISTVSDIPLVKTLLNQTITSALPIISFCQPFSMTSRLDDIILAMPRHLMIITNHNSVSVHPWQQSLNSTTTILECHWCTFLDKLLVTTLEDNQLFIYDLVSVIDTIQLRGSPLSVKHQPSGSKTLESSLTLPSASIHQPAPALSSQTRFTKSNSFGIYYCYISDRQYSCMLTRIDHNTRKHVKAIDCTGGSLNNRARICALGLSEHRVAVVLTNLVMTLYDSETLVGVRQIHLARSYQFGLRGVSALIYLWKTWLLFDPIDNRVVGIGRRKRQFMKHLPEQPINACTMENGTLAVWLGYPGAILYYRLID